jgi:microcystin-dependent protein
MTMKNISILTFVLLFSVSTLSFSQVTFGPPSGGSGSGNSAALNGDVKLSISSSLGGCWVAMQGQAKTSLLAAQQTAATALGIGANLPDARDRNLIGASATKLVLTVGGAETVTLAQAQLPNVALSVTAFTVPPSGGIWYYNGTAGNARMPTGGGGFDATSISSMTSNGSTASINGGVGQQATAVLDPYLAVNTFVCLL